MEGKDRNLMVKRQESDTVSPLYAPGSPMKVKTVARNTLYLDIPGDACMSIPEDLASGQRRIKVVFGTHNATWRERLRFRVAQVLVWLLDR